jgi:hypothetical protein
MPDGQEVTFCPRPQSQSIKVAVDLLWWLDELNAQNAGLKARNASLRKKLADGRY